MASAHLSLVAYHTSSHYLQSLQPPAQRFLPPASTQSCSLAQSTDKASQQIAAFNGIFLNDFSTSVTSTVLSGGRSYRPIAVFRNLSAPGYQIDDMTQLTSCCASDSGFTDYGLVVRGGISFTGNAYIYGSGNATVDLPSCKVGKASDSAFEFDSSATSYKAASQYLTALRPDLRIGSSNILASIGLQADPKYHVVTMGSCNGPFFGCLGAPFTTTSGIAASDARNQLTDLSALDRLSNAQGLLSGLSPYIGLNSSGLQWPTDATFVINVSCPKSAIDGLKCCIPNLLNSRFL